MGHILKGLMRRELTPVWRSGLRLHGTVRRLDGLAQKQRKAPQGLSCEAVPGMAGTDQ